MTLVTPEESPCYIGSIYAPIKLDVMLKPVFLDAKTIAIEHQFSIRADKCVGGVDNFVKNNLERLTTSGVWYDSDDQALDMYISEINRKYNIDLDRSSLKYTNQFCWEIEPESR
jgi:Holliday junction resolvase RusA-like endonuclease